MAQLKNNFLSFPTTFLPTYCELNCDVISSFCDAFVNDCSFVLLMGVNEELKEQLILCRIILSRNENNEICFLCKSTLGRFLFLIFAGMMNEDWFQWFTQYLPTYVVTFVCS